MNTTLGGRRSYAAVHPVAAMICDILPENERETTPSEVHFEDLEKIQVDDVARISEWLTEKVCPSFLWAGLCLRSRCVAGACAKPDTLALELYTNVCVLFATKHSSSASPSRCT